VRIIWPTCLWLCSLFADSSLVRPAADDTIPLDTTWIDEQDKKAASTLNSLELELNHHLSSQNKEGSRVTLNQLGHYYYGRGDYENALRTYLRPRTDCVTPGQILEMYTNVVRAMMALKRSSHAISYVAKAECVKPDAEAQSKVPPCPSHHTAALAHSLTHSLTHSRLFAMRIPAQCLRWPGLS